MRNFVCVCVPCKISFFCILPTPRPITLSCNLFIVTSKIYFSGNNSGTFMDTVKHIKQYSVLKPLYKLRGAKFSLVIVEYSHFIL